MLMQRLNRSDPETIKLAGALVAVRGNDKRLLISEKDYDRDGDIDLIVKIEKKNLAL